jgi:hypothetical protein
MRCGHVLPLIACLSLAACSSASTPPSPPAPNANELTLQTGEFQVPTGGDSLTCFYTDVITQTDLIVGNVTATQGPGGHHIIVYYIDTPHTVEHHPCLNSEMVDWNEIAGASNSGEPVVSLPEGAGIKLPAGKQIVIQSHYINTTAAVETVNDTINIDLLQAADVKQYINNWVINDATFLVQPDSTYKSVTQCTVAQDLQSVVLLGHMHEYGTHYTLESVDASGNSLGVIYDQVWQPLYATHPPLKTATLDAPFVIPMGTIIRQTCSWDNTTANPLSFPTEMCDGVVYYFPDNGFQVCDNKPVSQ